MWFEWMAIAHSLHAVSGRRERSGRCRAIFQVLLRVMFRETLQSMLRSVRHLWHRCKQPLRCRCNDFSDLMSGAFGELQCPAEAHIRMACSLDAMLMIEPAAFQSVSALRHCTGACAQVRV